LSKNVVRRKGHGLGVENALNDELLLALGKSAPLFVGDGLWINPCPTPAGPRKEAEACIRLGGCHMALFEALQHCRDLLCKGGEAVFRGDPVCFSNQRRRLGSSAHRGQEDAPTGK
jgi:hypothetical protein